VADDDRIVLANLSFFGYHGINPEERTLGQRFGVDLALTLDLAPAGRTDDLARTVSYAQVYRLVREVVEGPPCNLLEAVAERIAGVVLAQTPAQAVWVRVTKSAAPIKGMASGVVGVELRREQPHS
jgi:dihydroneopterin aldolase